MDENDAGAVITAVMTENATSVTVDNDHFEVADGETPDGMMASSTVDENVEGALLGAITLSDEDADQTHILTTSDDRFVTKQDAEGGWWLALADGVSLNFEDEASHHGAEVTVTVTVTDDGDPAMSASTDVTITVNDVNEAPSAQKELDDQSVESAGGNTKINWEVDLTGVLVDPDAGDSNPVYTLKGPSPAGDSDELTGADGKPLELSLAITRGMDKDGNPTLTGIITSSQAIKAGEFGAYSVSIVATDDDGAAGEAMFYVHVDDGNDAITAINLYHLNEDGTDGEKNYTYEVDVDENHAGEVNLGRITVDDIDTGQVPGHPNGMHKVTVDDKRFEIKKDDEGGLWLVKVAGAELDHENDEEAGEIPLEIMAVDYGSKDKDGNPAGKSLTRSVTVIVNDENDDPTATQGKAGWWVTVDERLDADEVSAGQWLTFMLQTGSGPNAAFMDNDSSAGDTLKYSIEVRDGPEFLEIGNGGTGQGAFDAGQIRNKAKMLPPEDGGVYNVRVTAEDSKGQKAHFDFQLTVAFSGADNEDNDPPSIDVTSERKIDEHPGEGVVVGTFTVSDDHNHLTGHPFAVSDMPTIESVMNDDTDQLITGPDGADLFKIEHVSGSTYRVVTTKAAKAVLDHDGENGVDDIKITVRVEDGLELSDTADIDVDIEDVNEAPMYVGAAGSKTVTVEQLQGDGGGKTQVWIRLYDVWDDPDGNDDDNDLEFDIESISAPWPTTGNPT